MLANVILCLTECCGFSIEFKEFKIMAFIGKTTWLFDFKFDVHD